MIDEEVFILTKHANFDADYIEKIPIYKRRHYLYLLQKENEEIEKLQDQAKNKYNSRSRR
jgi:hypothetical protein